MRRARDERKEGWPWTREFGFRSDHVAYTRLFIVSAAAGAADQDATTQRLLQNQSDIGNAVSDFYGREAGDKLTALLKDHLLIAAIVALQLIRCFTASVRDYDEAMSHMLMVADTLTDGIVAQFPSKFSHAGAASRDRLLKH